MRYDPGIRRSREKTADRRKKVIRTDAFRRSKAELEKTPEMRDACKRLMMRVETQPEQGVWVADIRAFVMKNHGWGYPTLRVYYHFDGRVIRPLHVEVFDVIGAGV